MNDFIERIARLSPERQALLQQLKKQRKVTAPIQLVSHERERKQFPLSFAQQRLWFLNELLPLRSVYNIPLALRFTGQLNKAALEHSLNAVIQRHEILRTTFHREKDELFQKIHKSCILSLPCIDLRAQTSEQREQLIIHLCMQAAEHCFDLSEIPLLRCQLLWVEEEHAILLLTLHHIITDSWSVQIMLEETCIFYNSFLERKPTALSPLSLQYNDYVLWQQQQIQHEAFQPHLTYWKEHLQESPPLLALPTDRPRPPILSYRGEMHAFTFPSPLVKNLKVICTKTEVSLFMLLFAALQFLLARYSNQEDFLIGVPVAGRSKTQLEPLVGLFVNTVVLRASVRKGSSVSENLQRVKKEVLDAFTHQDVPLEKIVEELRPQREMSYNPMFQVMFNFRNSMPSTTFFSGLDISNVIFPIRTAKVDLLLDILDDGNTIECFFEYSTDLFDEMTIQRMADHYLTLLEQIVTAPEQEVSRLSLLTTNEQQAMLSLHIMQVSSPPPLCLHKLFELQVERAPDSIALVLAEEQLSYLELNQRANRLAHFLQGRGVGAETRVGICLERTFEMVISILGILKAGGAYLPLDLVYPDERLAFLLSDASATFVITHTAHMNRLRRLATANVALLCIDDEQETIALKSWDNPVSLTFPLNLAYIIYTSGSTGKPKGVMISHAHVVRLFNSTQERFQFNERDTWSFFHSYAFDFSVWELWGGLLYGGRLVIVPELICWDFDAFYTMVCREQVTVLNQTPSAFRGFMQADSTAQNSHYISSLRYVIFGGEALELGSLIPWFEQHRDNEPQLVNMYGITETTVHVTYRPLTARETKRISGSVIGSPLPDLCVYVLDAYLHPVPFSVAGEIYVGGAGVARGYLDRPTLTAERFLPDPFSGQPGARLYRTGDMARYLSNGELEYLGRNDKQVKVRGFRIELGEIESVLTQHQHVREAVVLAQNEGSAGKKLVAYITPLLDDINDIQKYLVERLPYYMLPSAIKSLETMPLTSNKKIDLDALSKQVIAQSATDHVSPRDAIELQLVRMWEEILDVKPVGVKDKFFELGGHSLQAALLIGQIEDLFEKKIPLATLFQGGTIECLADFIRSKNKLEPSSPLIRLQIGGQKRPFFAIHSGGGSVMAYIDLIRYIDKEQPVYGLEASGLENGQELPGRIEDMALEYIAAIRRIQPEGPYLLGGYSFGGFVAFEMGHQLELMGQQVALLVMLDTTNFFDDSALPYSTGDDAIYWFEKFKGELTLSLEDMRTLSPEDILDYVLEQVKKSGKAFPRYQLSNARRILLLEKTLDYALHHYQCRPFPGKITLIRATEQPELWTADETLGWRDLALQGVEVFTVPGNHFNMMRTPHVEQVAQLLQECIFKSEKFL